VPIGASEYCPNDYFKLCINGEAKSTFQVRYISQEGIQKREEFQGIKKGLRMKVLSTIV